MMTIALQGAEFFAYHGFYPEEQKLGCRFLVDVEVDFSPKHDFSDDNINNTVDYEKVYNIACEEMKHPRKLIETVAEAIIEKIVEKYPFVQSIRVAVKKLNPPLIGKIACSSVTINYQPAK